MDSPALLELKEKEIKRKEEEQLVIQNKIEKELEKPKEQRDGDFLAEWNTQRDILAAQIHDIRKQQTAAIQQEKPKPWEGKWYHSKLLQRLGVDSPWEQGVLVFSSLGAAGYAFQQYRVSKALVNYVEKKEFSFLLEKVLLQEETLVHYREAAKAIRARGWRGFMVPIAFYLYRAAGNHFKQKSQNL